MRVICYGDSNTYGYDPRTPFGDRYDVVWTELLAQKTGWSICNAGENGREIPKGEISFPDDVDLIIVMLGTNDLLQFWSPEAACDKMERFLTGLIRNGNRVLLIAPPPMAMGEWVQDQELIDDSITLGKLYRKLAEKLNAAFADAGMWHIPLAFDGVHLTQEGQSLFAEGLFQQLINLNLYK